MSSPQQPEIMRSIFTVTRKEYITPHYIRVFLTGEDVALVALTTVGANNKILVPPSGVKEVFLPKENAITGVLEEPAPELKPFMRTYTHRGIDMERKEIWIDFVVHGDEGPASAWAIRAEKGDTLGVMMKLFKKELYPERNWYLLVGDATALPVLGAILETLPDTARGTAIIEVYGKEDEQDLTAPPNMEIIWLHNPNPQQGSGLATAARQVALPENSRFAFVAGEFSTVKELRTYFRKENNWTKEELYAFSYWKSGVAEDKSAADRRSEMTTE